MGRRIGGAPLLLATSVVVFFAAYSCSNDWRSESAEPKIAPSYLSKPPRPSPATSAKPKSLDLTQPIETISHAVVCDQGVFLQAVASRAADALDKLDDAFYSVFNRSEKVRRAGCEEWRAGIRVFHVHEWHGRFLAFSVDPNGSDGYFTMKSHLANAEESPRQEAKDTSEKEPRPDVGSDSAMRASPDAGEPPVTQPSNGTSPSGIEGGSAPALPAASKYLEWAQRKASQSVGGDEQR